MSLTRRSLLQLGAACAATFALPACRRPLQATPSATSRARYCVVVFLRGGIDAIFTTDPRRPDEVAPGVDVPYESARIVPGLGGRLGPHLAPLARVPLTILNGVRVHTANHETGAAQVLRMRTRVLPAMPSLLDIIGSRREGQPLASVSLGQLKEHEHSQRWFSSEQLRLVERASPEDRRLLAGVMRNQAARLPATRQTVEESLTRENLESAAAFLARSAALPPPTVSSWDANPTIDGVGADLQRTLWLLENDLTKTVFAKAYLAWDTHERNSEGQSAAAPFFTVLQRFFAELARRKNAHGVLADLTRVVVLSEVGRFPRLNGDAGKDHFPEVPILFHGAATSSAIHGRTGRSMEALPIDPATGRAGAHFVALDDVGATLLRSFGVAPAPHGYDGRVLDFLGMT